MKHYEIPAEAMIKTADDLQQALQFRDEMIEKKRQEKILNTCKNSFYPMFPNYGTIRVQMGGRGAGKIAHYEELVQFQHDIIVEQGLLIQEYQEALEAMTAERNKYYKEGLMLTIYMMDYLKNSLNI